MVFSDKNEFEDTLTLGQRIANRLRAQILDGTLAENAPLRQNQLAEQLGVSNNPLREALRLLEAEGFVTIHPYRGATVRSISIGEVRQICQILTALEMRAIRLAIPNLREADLQHALDINAALRHELEVNRRLQLDFEFHAALYSRAHMPMLMDLIRTHHHIGRRYSRAVLAVPGQQWAFGPMHEELVALCRAGDVIGAESLVERHLRYATDTLVRHLERLQEEKTEKTLCGMPRA
jgi:DNA-binding GntR family transcriptional regulator